MGEEVDKTHIRLFHSFSVDLLRQTRFIIKTEDEKAFINSGTTFLLGGWRDVERNTCSYSFMVE